MLLRLTISRFEENMLVSDQQGSFFVAEVQGTQE